MSKNYNAPCWDLIYIAGRDFGYQFLSEIISEGNDISLYMLEEAIYNHLIENPNLSYYIILCEKVSKQAAKRVFDNFKPNIFLGS